MRKFCLALAAFFLVLACDKTQPAPEPQPTPDPTPAVQEQIPIRISLSSFTKATDSAYESGDAVGLYVVNEGASLAASGNQADNVAFTFDGSQWKSATTLYWKDNTTKASFYCYYPHSGSPADIKALPFSVKQNQSAQSDYKASELLWGCKKDVAPTSNAVEISTNHRMSNLLVYILPGNGYTAESLAQEEIKVRINNLKPAATLNLESGVVTATGNAADITPYKEGDHFRALIPPQSLQNQTLISITVGSYSFSFKENITLKSNTQHKVNLTVNKVSEGISIGIGDWENDDTDYGGTVN